jgi:hypothetical protein
MESPAARNDAAIQRLEGLLADLRANRSTARETEAIREIGFELAISIREVGAMLVGGGWGPADAATPGSDDRSARKAPA